jgi:hypothetical protein
MAGKSNGAQKWQQSMQSGATQQAYKDGISATTVNPMERAANAEESYLQGVQDAVSSGRRKQKLLATPVSAWRDGALNKGAGRLTSGAAAAARKVADHFQKFQPIYDGIKSHVASMPNMTTEDKINRVRYAMNTLRQAAGKSV